MRHKNIESKTPWKVGTLAAAVALALPLYAGCMKNEAAKPVQQPTKPAAEMSQPVSAPKTGSAPLITVTPQPEPVPKVLIPVNVPVAPMSTTKPASCPEDISGIITRKNAKAITPNGNHFQETFSVAEGSTLYIEGYGTRIALRISKIDTSFFKVEDLTKNRFEKLPYDSNIQFAGKEGGAWIMVERVKEPCMMNLTITGLELYSKHPVLPAFDIFIIGRQPQSLSVKAGDKVKVSTCLEEKIVVSEVNRKGIVLAGFGLLEYGQLLRIGESALVAIVKAEKGKEKGTAKLTIISPDFQRINFQTKP